MGQYGLPLTENIGYSAADFVVSACNETAHAAISLWPDWPQPVLLLHGPPASGKTHLAHIWAAQSGAGFLDAAVFDREAVEAIIGENRAAGAWVLEHLEALEDETALFHLLNAVREQGGSLFITAAASAGQLAVSLPDLRSRLAAVPAAELYAPDDIALRAVVVKQFADRQLRVGEDVLRYLLARMDRSFLAARRWVERLDAAALERQSRVTVALVRQLMEAEGGGQSELFPDRRG